MNKTFKKTLSIILTILMIVTTIPLAFAAGDGVPLTIDLSEVTSSYAEIGNGYKYYDEDGYIITGTNTNVTIDINDSCDIIFNDMSAKGVYLWSSAENVTVTLDGDNYLDGSGFICNSTHLTINGDDDDTLTIKSSSGAFSTGGNPGSLTVNGGKINAVTETTSNYPTIWCGGGFILNGGEVTASNNYYHVIKNKTIINGGTLNVISTSPNQVAINDDVEIAKGALLTASATYKLIRSDYNITPVNEAEENLLFFARFDKDSDFSIVSDIKAAIEDKTYAEIKVDTHEHDLDNSGKCICGYACPHESITDGICGDCGYNCLHENYTDGVCGVCGYACPHESVTDGKCADCGYECLHEGQSGSCKVCGANLGKLVIDVTDKSFVEIGNGYDYYDEDGYIITGTNQYASVNIIEETALTLSNLTLGALYFNNAPNDSVINITLDGTTEVTEFVSLYRAHLIFDGGETDVFKVPYFSTAGNSGSVTVNSGNIILDCVTEYNLSAIACDGGFTINGGTVTASNNYFYVVSRDVTLNGGELNIISTAADHEAISSDITMDKGALLTVSAESEILYKYGNIVMADGAQENDYFFVRYDTESEFVPVYDIRAALDGKTYAEIKIDTHEHSFENGKCDDCGYECLHEGQSGSCKVCGVNLGKLVIDLSKVTVSSFTIGNGRTYYDEDGYIITGTNKNVKIKIFDSCDITFNNMSANSIILSSETASNVNVTLDGDNYMYGAFDVYQSHLTINGDDDDTLAIVSNTGAFYTAGYYPGTLTVNGGKINAVTETTDIFPTIFCDGGFTLNGGEVTASNNYSYVIVNNKTIINGGTLNVISTSPYYEAIIGDVEIAKGALLTASATYKVIRSLDNITPVNEAEENLSLFARFDTDTDFVPVSDIKAALEGKTYAEIKVDTHEHSGGTATCVSGKICELCKAEYSEVDVDAHDIVVDEAVAPTCTETGLTEGSHCSHCEDMTVEQEVIPDLGGHIDADGDYLCDHGCGHEFENPADNCDHLCHKDGILGFFWKIACFFFRLFNLQQYCDCGEIHYDAPILG